MNLFQREHAVLHYLPCSQLPILHFGFWRETLERWVSEGHLTADDLRNDDDPSLAAHNWASEAQPLALKLGFEGAWAPPGVAYHNRMFPGFPREIIRELPDGSRHVLNGDGVVLLENDGAVGIPAEIEHRLTDRASWEKDFKWRMQWHEQRVDLPAVEKFCARQSFAENPLRNIFAGSLYGFPRDVLGVTGLAYLLADDEDLFDEILATVADTALRAVEKILQTGERFGSAHFWEDICFKNGPLVNPRVFAEKVGPHYRRLTELLRAHGVEIISLDCDGMIDELLPIWLDNGVNLMFPIEVGTWGASLAPWRKKYGDRVLGVGGMDKKVFAYDRAAIDNEIERLRPLVALGGFIPCPDHRIQPDAQWDLVRYYCDQMRAVFWR